MSSALATIQSLLDAGDFYTAHQKTRTSAIRLLTSRRAPTSTTSAPLEFDAKAQEAANLLWVAGKTLLEKGEVGSGADLVGLLVGVWEARGVACGETERAQVIQLIALIGPSGSWRKTFTDTVFSWSAKTGSGAAGDVAIHGYYGEVLFKEQNYHLASLHLIVSPTQDSARTLADAMFAWSKLDGEGMTAVGRYAARGTISYLECEAILPARIFLSHFLSLALAAYPSLLVVTFPFPPSTSALAKTSSESPDELIVTKLASLNFLQLAVKNCQVGLGESIEKTKGADGVFKAVKGKGRLGWQTIVGRYERDVSWLKRPEVKESTQELGQIYFGIKPPRPAGNAMMDMLGSMFGGGAGGAPAIAGR